MGDCFFLGKKKKLKNDILKFCFKIVFIGCGSFCQTNENLCLFVPTTCLSIYSFGSFSTLSPRLRICLSLPC